MWVVVIMGYFVDALISVIRTNTVLFRDIPMQFDVRDDPERTYGAGAAPFFTYDVMIQQVSSYGITLYSVKQSDKFTDTLASRDYRVVSDPQIFPDDHLECIVTKTRGT